MILSLSSIVGIYVLAVSSVLPAPSGGMAVDTPARPAVIITPASYPAAKSVTVPDDREPARQPETSPVAKLPVEAEDDYPGTCRVGTIVMIPDGREGQVTSREGDTCRVLAYGEAFVSLWNEDMIEPVYPQPLPRRAFGH